VTKMTTALGGFASLENADRVDAVERRRESQLHLFYLIDSLSPGGAEHSLAALVPELVARGVKVDVACVRARPGLQERFQAAGARLFSLSSRHRAQSIWRARRIIRARRPDLVHTTLFESNILGRVAVQGTKIPLVTSLVNLTYGPEQASDPRYSARQLRLTQAADIVTARRVTRFHALSGYVAEVMSRRLLIPRNRVDVIPRARDPQVLGVRSAERRERARRELGIESDGVVVLAASRQEHQKGLDVLLEAFGDFAQSNQDARLILCGQPGTQSSALSVATRLLGLDGRVRYLGVRGDLPELMCAADVFVLPSRWEGLGGVVLEAMALEVPIVASDLPALKGILQADRNALLVRPEQPQVLANALSAVTADPEAAAKRTEEARKDFENSFTAAAIANQMLAFYERALTEGGTKA
jgi:glycosyltransferase involved in cell wall biosynthesis